MIETPIHRVASALIAVFCAHLFATAVAAPLEGLLRRPAFLEKSLRWAGNLDERSPAPGPMELPETRPEPAEPPDLVAYEGLGSWIDLFDRGPWAHPARTIARMDRKGVRTVYLQTSNYASRHDVMKPARVARFIAAAHMRGLAIVGWTVPSFSYPRQDWAKIEAALTSARNRARVSTHSPWT